MIKHYLALFICIFPVSSFCMDEKMLAVESNVPLKKLTLILSSGSVLETGVIPSKATLGFSFSKPELPVSKIIVETASKGTLTINKLEKTPTKQFRKIQVYVTEDKKLVQLFLPPQGDRQPIIQNT